MYNVALTEAYLRTKWHLDPSSYLATVDMAEKLGVLCPFPFLGGAGSPSNTMSPGPRLSSIPIGILIHPAVWPQQTWAENWGIVPPFWGGGGAGSASDTMWPGPRLTSVPSGILIHPAVWPQYMGRKLGAAVPPFYSGPQLKQCRGCLPLGGGQLGPHLTQCGLSGGHLQSSMPSGILIRPAVWPQYTNVTGRRVHRLYSYIGHRE